MSNDSAANSRPLNDTSTIDVYDTGELQRWAEYFGVSQERLQIAVAVVGTSAEAVRKYFGKSCRIGMD